MQITYTFFMFVFAIINFGILFKAVSKEDIAKSKCVTRTGIHEGVLDLALSEALI